jgi:hypothetical protein
VHDLKHTFGRRLRAAGVSFEDRQKFQSYKSNLKIMKQVNDSVSLTCFTFLSYQALLERMLMALNYHFRLFSNNTVSFSGRVLSIPE